MSPDTLEPQVDPLYGFKRDLQKYQQCCAHCAEFEEQEFRGDSARFEGPSRAKRDFARRVAAEGLWVSGMASLFDLLTTNYKAQERLVAEQLKHAEKSSEAADKVARWTKWLVVVTAVLILTTALSPLLAKAPVPNEVRLSVPGLVMPPQASAIIPVDTQSPQSPTHDQ